MIENIQDIWQVEAAGKIYDTSFEEMTTWIAEGSLIREDKVRKGNLRWIEAGKVPSLVKFFNAKDAGEPIMPVVTVSAPVAAESESDDILELSANQSPKTLAPGADHADVHDFLTTSNTPQQAATPSDVCSIHAHVSATYVCESCANSFCKACPKSYGGTVKICPSCGALCRSLGQVEKKRVETDIRHRASTEAFGFGDFFESLAYPFKFATSLIFGSVMFAMFSLGQSAGVLGGIFMIGAAIVCYLLANMLTFGVLANTVENFSQGKLSENFMPSFEDFSLWDDVVHPFFLSIGVYVSSFGPLLVLVLVTVFFLMNTVSNEMNGVQSDAARIVRPDLPLAANAAKQTEKVKELINKNNEFQKNRVEAIERGEADPASSMPEQNPAALEEQSFDQVNQMIQDHRKAQLEAVVGKTPETVAKEREAMISKILGYGAGFLILGGVFLMWGLFYFPAACAVAGYTRSFSATLNLAVGLDTIKRLGVDYIKILLMSLLIVIASSFVIGSVSAVLSAFDMPGIGNVPAKFIGSLFTFYFSVVFSCVIGFAMYKASDRLKLYQG